VNFNFHAEEMLDGNAFKGSQKGTELLATRIGSLAIASRAYPRLTYLYLMIHSVLGTPVQGGIVYTNRA